MDYNQNNFRNSGEIIPAIDRERPMFIGLFLAIVVALAYWLLWDVLFHHLRELGFYPYTTFHLITRPIMYAYPLGFGIIMGFAYFLSFGKRRRVAMLVSVATFLVYLIAMVFIESIVSEQSFFQVAISTIYFNLPTSLGIGLMVAVDRYLRGLLDLLSGLFVYLAFLVSTPTIVHIYYNFGSLTDFHTEDFLAILNSISYVIFLNATPAVAWTAARLVEQAQVRRLLKRRNMQRTTHLM